ncbi:hypothetical protein Gotri_022486 [Gossypium trilobum]|uniref:RNase H type-1 domain-containing protein n=1 Tax=Gossypium trilobum TaxID=34281 RepID=A0A7J9DFW5_9ROSI|nr:hypothetical protein [Gossypium trilobum]
MTVWVLCNSHNKQVKENNLQSAQEVIVRILKGFDELEIRLYGHLPLRFVIRDREGLVMGNGMVINTHVCDAFIAEALAILQSLQFASEMGFTMVVVEGDSGMVISKVMQRQRDKSQISAYISDIKCLVSSFYRAISKMRVGNVIWWLMR